MISILRAGLHQVAVACSPDADPAQVMAEGLQRSLVAVEQAVAVGVQLLCLPELCLLAWFPGGPDDRWLDLAEPLPGGPALERLQRSAGNHRCVLVVPLLERATDGRIHSSAAVIDADGSLTGVARRHHLLPAEQRQLQAADSGFTVFDTTVARLGVVLGYDRHLPEVARIMGQQGAELILFPAAATDAHPRVLWEAEALAVAAQNHAWVGACNRVGIETLQGSDGAAQRLEFTGGSYLADPRGRFHARASRDRASTIRVDIALGRLRQERSRRPLLRRPQLYGSLVEP